MMSGHRTNSIFSNKNKIKIGRPEHSLNPLPLCLITSHFCLSPPHLLKVDVICGSPLNAYSKVPNKRPPPPFIFFEKKIQPPAVIKSLRLLIFGFSSLASKKIEQCKTYLSIRNSTKSNEIDFSECFHFQCYF